MRKLVIEGRAALHAFHDMNLEAAARRDNRRTDRLPRMGVKEAGDGDGLVEKFRAQVKADVAEQVKAAGLEMSSDLEKEIEERVKTLADGLKADLPSNIKAALEASSALFSAPQAAAGLAWKDHAGETKATRADKETGVHTAHIVQPTRLKSIQGLLTKAGISDGDIIANASAVDALDAWVALIEMDPFRAVVQVIPFSGAAASLPKYAGAAFAKENAQPDDARTPGGAISGQQITLDRYTNEIAVTHVALNDVPGLRDAIAFDITQQWGAACGAAVFDAAKTSVNAAGAQSFSKVKTGAAAALPSADDIWAKMADMVAAIKRPYRPSCRFQLSRAVESLLVQHAPSGGSYAFNPALGVMTINGYPVEMNDHLDDGNAAGEVSALFGNFRRALILAEGNPLILAEEYAQTRPGQMTYFSEGRCKGATRDTAAMAGLSTAA